MLKRQRQPSPVPSSSNIPLVSDSPADEIVAARNIKRRRTQPPVLDGASRGWNHPLENDDEEDYEPSDDENQSHRTFPSVDEAATDEYRSTNNLLRELHVLQQHRHLFSPQSKAMVFPIQPVQPGPSGKVSPEHFWQTEQPASVPPFDESRVVHQHYGDTNRLLRELFLARRREIGTPVFEPSP